MDGVEGTGLARAGAIVVDHVYMEYDCEPLLFSAKSESGQLWLAVAVDEDSDGTMVLLYAEITAVALALIEVGEVDVREAFESAPSGRVAVVRSKGGEIVASEWLATSEIGSEWLPDRGARLSSMV